MGLPVKMAAWGDTLCLLTQPQEESQLTSKQNPELPKIKLYGSPTTKDTNKPHHPNREEGVEGEPEQGVPNRWSHIHMWWIKIGRDTFEGSNPSPRPDSAGF